MSTTPSLKVAKMVWATAGFRCSILDCRKPLYFDKTEVDDHSLVGEMAHIAGEKSGSARYDYTMVESERNAFDNLILLCGHHHAVIDTQPGMYTVDLLRQIKLDHTDWVNKALTAALHHEPVGRPSLALAIVSPTGLENGIVIDNPPVDDEEMAISIAKAIIAMEPIIPRAEIMQMPAYRSGKRSPFDMGSGLFNQRTGLYDADISSYEHEYECFAEDVLEWARAFVSLGKTHGPLIGLNISVANFGNLAAGSVQVEATLTEGWHFMPADFLEKGCGLEISPTKLFSESPLRFMHQRNVVARPDIFHQIGEADEDLTSSEVAWHCQELRQNKEHILQAILVRTEPSAPPATLSISAASATLTQSAQIVLKVSTSDRPDASLETYLKDRLVLIPTKYHQRAIAGLSSR